jgi:hypothetical protein
MQTRLAALDQSPSAVLLAPQAASYEVVFVLLVAAACTLASWLAVTAATHRILSRDHRLRVELLLPRVDRRVGSMVWFQAELEQVPIRAVTHACCFRSPTPRYKQCKLL